MHRDTFCNKYCEPCEVPVCDSCPDHKPYRIPFSAWPFHKRHSKHKLVNIRSAYDTKRQQHKVWIHTVRSETLSFGHVLLRSLESKVNTDILTLKSEVSRVMSEMILKDKKVKYLMHNVIQNLRLQVRNGHRCLQQKNKMNQFIARIQMCEYRFEQSAGKRVQFLRFIKKAHLPQIQDTPLFSGHCHLSLTQEVNIKDLIELLCKIKIMKKEKCKLQVVNEFMTTFPEWQNSFLVKDVYSCGHISYATPDRLWVSDHNNLILMDTANAAKLLRVKDQLNSLTGIHTVNGACELIYIDKEHHIKKLSKNMKTTIIIIKNTNSAWKPWCLYCSPLNGDLLIGMVKRDTDTNAHAGKVMRYDNTGRHTQTIPINNDKPDVLYKFPFYITENKNGDVVVSDFDRHAVVVTTNEGIPRFYYARPPQWASEFKPRGVCTDALSHILVCDWTTDTVHMLNQDGEFLKYLLTEPYLFKLPMSLSYDVFTHRLLVGSMENKEVSVFRHINRSLSFLPFEN